MIYIIRINGTLPENLGELPLFPTREMAEEALYSLCQSDIIGNEEDCEVYSIPISDLPRGWQDEATKVLQMHLTRISENLDRVPREMAHADCPDGPEDFIEKYLIHLAEYLAACAILEISSNPDLEDPPWPEWEMLMRDSECLSKHAEMLGIETIWRLHLGKRIEHAYRYPGPRVFFCAGKLSYDEAEALLNKHGALES